MQVKLLSNKEEENMSLKTATEQTWKEKDIYTYMAHIVRWQDPGH